MMEFDSPFELSQKKGVDVLGIEDLDGDQQDCFEDLPRQVRLIPFAFAFRRCMEGKPYISLTVRPDLRFEKLGKPKASVARVTASSRSL